MIQPANMPPGTTRRGNTYVSPRGGVYDLAGEYVRCSVKNPPQHPDVPAGSEWDGTLWVSKGGDGCSMDGLIICEC